jgi:hypothetical protein
VHCEVLGSVQSTCDEQSAIGVQRVQTVGSVALGK